MRTYAFIALALTTAACTADQFHPDTSDSGTNPDNSVGGGEGGAGDGGAGGDGGVAPGTDAVYVSSSTGSANGDGTQAHPFSSLDAAIAKAGKLPVYACAETYAEQVHFLEGVNVSGDYDCNAGWTKTTSHARIASKVSPAVIASNITNATTVEAVDIVAPDFTDQSQSSIGILATKAVGLTIKNATIHAGTGGQGAAGTDGIPLKESTTKDGQDGWASGKCTGSACQFLLHTGSPAGGTNACTGATGHDGGPGGAGGDSGEFQSQFVIINNQGQYKWVTINNEDSTAGSPSIASSQTNQGGALNSGGQNGIAGANGKDGIPGSNFGNIVNGAYAPSDGTAGADGMAGQGGGGSGAMQLASIYSAQAYSGYYGWGEPGAGGGAGGCPGLAGGLGKGGGASIAIIAVDAGFTLDTVTIESSKGGDGGKSGNPSAHTSGGFGGKSGQYVPSAGNGGDGGLAGVSGNGGGGPSVGIAYNKVKPTLLASPPVKHDAGGLGVTVRTVNAQTIPASDNGMSADAYMFGQ